MRHTLRTSAVAVTALLAIGLTAAPGHAQDGGDQVGLLNLNNTDILHNVNVSLDVCNSNINVLGVNVPIQDAIESSLDLSAKSCANE